MLSSAVKFLMIELLHHWLGHCKQHAVLLKMSLQSGIMGSFDKALQFFPSFGTSRGEAERTTRFKATQENVLSVVNKSDIKTGSAEIFELVPFHSP